MSLCAVATATAAAAAATAAATAEICSSAHCRITKLVVSGAAVVSRAQMPLPSASQV